MKLRMQYDATPGRVHPEKLHFWPVVLLSDDTATACCLRHNRPQGCPDAGKCTRAHVCAKCGDSEHNIFGCQQSGHGDLAPERKRKLILVPQQTHAGKYETAKLPDGTVCCLRYNRPSGCPGLGQCTRSHACSKCGVYGHTAYDVFGCQHDDSDAPEPAPLVRPAARTRRHQAKHRARAQ